MAKNQLALIIEDDLDLINIFSSALDEAGYLTENINEGKSAIERLNNWNPDIIILDLHLPHVSGVDILRHIRENDQFANTRVIIVTADPQLANTVSDLADLVLIKPVSFTQLRDLAIRMLASDAKDL
ncbi:MAG: response regulator [Chloroflexi bacterium]|nr:response regulator [Chloroflexota bacterium]